MRLRMYTIDRLQLKFGSSFSIPAITPIIEKGRKISENPEAWDLGALITIFTEYKDTLFKPDFGDHIQRVLPVLYAIREMRNRRAHEISRKFPIFAREAYSLAD